MATAKKTENAEPEVAANIPHVHVAVGAILKSLSVEKGGVLPSNMGGKPYITAVDLNLEAKRQFVANDLILVPNETVIKYEPIVANNRLSVLIAIEGSYTLISLVDNSELHFRGSGDGLANGSAVASNIASTNALKNALLRLFLVTEQSVEEAAKAGIDTDEKVAPRALSAAKTAPAAPSGNSEVAELQGKIKAVAEKVNPEDPKYYSRVGAEMFPDVKGWASKAANLKKLLAALEEGAGL